MEPINERLDTLFYECELGILTSHIVGEYFVRNINNDFELFIDLITNNGETDLYDYDEMFEYLHEDIFLILHWLEQKYIRRYNVDLKIKNIVDPNMMLKAVLYFVFLDCACQYNPDYDSDFSG